MYTLHILNLLFASQHYDSILTHLICTSLPSSQRQTMRSIQLEPSPDKTMSRNARYRTPTFPFGARVFPVGGAVIAPNAQRNPDASLHLPTRRRQTVPS